GAGRAGGVWDATAGLAGTLRAGPGPGGRTSSSPPLRLAFTPGRLAGETPLREGGMGMRGECLPSGGGGQGERDNRHGMAEAPSTDGSSWRDLPRGLQSPSSGTVGWENRTLGPEGWWGTGGGRAGALWRLSGQLLTCLKEMLGGGGSAGDLLDVLAGYLEALSPDVENTEVVLTSTLRVCHRILSLHPEAAAAVANGGVTKEEPPCVPGHRYGGNEGGGRWRGTTDEATRPSNNNEREEGDRVGDNK
ncbi:unnamed protein product, partial [Discosporangium mesarthrocarpum]